MLQTENENLRTRIKAMHEAVEALTTRNTQLLAERDASNVKNMGEGQYQRLGLLYICIISLLIAMKLDSQK